VEQQSKMKTLLGTKVGMTQILGDDGVMIPITLVLAGPCVVTQIKTVENDGYSAVQIGYGSSKNLNNAVSGHVRAAGKAMSNEGFAPKVIREVRVNEDEIGDEIKVGASFNADIFAVGDSVNVTGVSKGKGFAGNVKRNNFSTSKKTHGGNGNVRKPGSIGSMYPQKVFKGKRMAGRMGHDNVTVRNLVVAYVNSNENVIGIKGAVPGPRKGIVTIGGDK
jgi:large subunit ribosomal protein L3